MKLTSDAEPGETATRDEVTFETDVTPRVRASQPTLVGVGTKWRVKTNRERVRKSNLLVSGLASPSGMRTTRIRANT